MGNKLIYAPILAAMSFGGMYFILGNMFKAPAVANMLNACPLPYFPIYETKRASQLHRRYTGIEVIDQLLCTLVGFFFASFGEDEYPTTLALLTSFAPVVIFPFVESGRKREVGSKVPAIVPMIVGLIFQRFGGGVVLPLYWVFILLTGAMDNKKNKQITPRAALAAVAGLTVGYYIPTYLMYSTKGITVTAIWQAFPALVMITQFAVLLFAPEFKAPSGARIVQAIYASTFVFGAYNHLLVLSQIKSTDSLSFTSVFLPSLKPIISETVGPVAKNFLQWDYVFIMGSAATLTLSYAKSVEELVSLFATYAILTPALGAGAAFSAVMIWREERMFIASKQVVKKD